MRRLWRLLANTMRTSCRVPRSSRHIFENVRRVTIPDAEHHPHQENKKAFLELVESHLESLS